MQERDCSDEIELRNGKANSFGWSSAAFWHNDTYIGSHSAGDVIVSHPAYRFEIKKEGDVTRLIFYCKINEDSYS